MGKIHTRSEHTYTKLRTWAASWHGAAEGASEEEPRDAVCSLNPSPGRAHGPVGEKVPRSHTACERSQSHHGLRGRPGTSLSTLCGDGESPGCLQAESLHSDRTRPLSAPAGSFRGWRAPRRRIQRTLSLRSLLLGQATEGRRRSGAHPWRPPRGSFNF